MVTEGGHFVIVNAELVRHVDTETLGSHLLKKSTAYFIGINVFPMSVHRGPVTFRNHPALARDQTALRSDDDLEIHSRLRSCSCCLGKGGGRAAVVQKIKTKVSFPVLLGTTNTWLSGRISYGGRRGSHSQLFEKEAGGQTNTEPRKRNTPQRLYLFISHSFLSPYPALL